MTPEQEDALEVAKLAAMVGGQLKKIDQFTSERSNTPANKININNFIAKVHNPSLKVGPAKYLVDAPQGFALPPDESMIQSMVPDTSIGSPNINPVSELSNVNFSEPNINIHAGSPIIHSETKKVVKQESFNSLITRSDIDSFRNTLKSIDKTLAGMLNFLKNSKNSNE